MNDSAKRIYELLGALEKKYLSSDKIFRAIIENDTTKLSRIDFVDALCQTVVTSLNFGNCNRAAKYLALTESFCRKYF